MPTAVKNKILLKHRSSADVDYNLASIMNTACKTKRASANAKKYTNVVLPSFS